MTRTVSYATSVWQNDTLYSSTYDDLYFNSSTIDEIDHVFIDGNDLRTRFDAVGSQFVIGELGFGTGANFWRTLDVWKASKSSGWLDFYSVECHPIPPNDMHHIVAHLCAHWSNYWRHLAQFYPKPIEGLYTIIFPKERARLHLIIGFAEEALKEQSNCMRSLRKANAWFLDGFNPSKNPSMWSKDLFETIATLSAPEATLATFSAAGWVRRNLEEVGFLVKKKKGFGRKRDMLTAQWHSLPACCSPSVAKKQVGIIGAGLAGYHLAHHLQQFGCDVTVFSKDGQWCGGGGSAQSACYLYRRFDALDTMYGKCLEQAFHYARMHYLLYQNDAWRALPLVSSENAQGIDSGVIYPSKLQPLDCQLVNGCVSLIERRANDWLIYTDSQTFCVEHLVIASGVNSLDLLPQYPNSALPFYSLSGFSSGVALEKSSVANYLLTKDATIDCSVPNTRINASFGYDSTQGELSDADLAHKLLAMELDGAITDRQFGIRLATPDRYPVAGLLPELQAWLEANQGIRYRRYLPTYASSQELSILTGLGAKGSIWAPYCAYLLAADIAGYFVPNAKIYRQFDPSRFLLRALKRRQLDDLC